jgi:peroxiredoxin
MTTIIKSRQDATAWQKRFEAQAPKVGDYAPNFELRDSSGSNPVKLSEFHGQRPVALVFGSFT